MCIYGYVMYLYLVYVCNVYVGLAYITLFGRNFMCMLCYENGIIYIIYIIYIYIYIYQLNTRLVNKINCNFGNQDFIV